MVRQKHETITNRVNAISKHKNERKEEAKAQTNKQKEVTE
jgi:hypothetical protein